MGVREGLSKRWNLDLREGLSKRLSRKFDMRWDWSRSRSRSWSFV